MCGRFARYCRSEDLERYFDAQAPPFEITPSYNVAPGQEIPVVIQIEDARHFRKHRWGLVPFWAADISIGSRMINARVETLAVKPAFKHALRRRRCLVPANGFYEWKGRGGGKQPYYICLPSGDPMAFAGLYELWENKGAPPGAAPYPSCTIITMEAGEAVKDIHHRMPLILKPEAYAEWLDPQNREVDKIQALLKTRYVKELSRRPVPSLVNRVENDTAACIEPSPPMGTVLH